MFFKNDRSDSGTAVAEEPDVSAAPRRSSLKELDEIDSKDVDDRGTFEGWTVHTADGRKVGIVDSLIVDTRSMKVRFLDVIVDKEAAESEIGRYVRIPAKRKKPVKNNGFGRLLLLGTALGVGSLLAAPAIQRYIRERDT